MRKILICMLALLMLLSSVLVACGGGDSGTENKPGESTSQADTSKKPGGDTSKPGTSKNPGGETKPSEKPSGNSAESPACVHEAVTDAAVEATCTTDGKTEGSHCAKCGEILVAQEVIPAGHIFVDGICTRCGMKLSTGLEYSLNDDGTSYSVTGIGSCEDTNIVIPPTYNGKPVTSIEYGAFSYCSGLTGVTIPNSVTSIKENAFNDCSGLTSVTIPDSVTSIGNSAFAGCTRITSVTIPDSVTNIGMWAFADCTGLASIIIPDSITSIGPFAFEGTAYYNDESNWENDVLYIGNCLIQAKNSLSGSYSIKDGTVCIADSAFHYGLSGYTGLTSVTIPDSVISIGSSAFQSCSGLTKVIIPDSVKTIGSSAFYLCSGLTSVIIGNGVTSIENRAFFRCTNLANITIGNSVTSIDVWAFDETAYYKDSSNWENGALYLGNCLIGTKSALKGSYSIKEGTVCIAGTAFEGRNITSITIPDSVVNIGSEAFHDSALATVTIPDSVTSIGEKAFLECYALTSITIGSGVTSIGEGAFSSCRYLTSVTYNGTKEQWEKISKGYAWNYDIGELTVHCTDGEIAYEDA